MTRGQSPEIGVATSADAGRSCPYCRFPIKDGAQIAVCGVCRAPHHGECWDENGGCAVVACVGGPGAVTGSATPAAPPTFTAPQPNPPGAGWVAMPQPLAQRGNRGWIPAALVLVALAVAGGAVVFVIDRHKQPTTTTVAPQTVTTVETQTVAQPTEPASVAFGGESRVQMADEISSVLYQHHEDIVNGDFAAAWDLLSARKQRRNLVKYGYATWERNQATLSPYLDPSGIQVRIVQLNPRTGEATVDVTGMTWSKPGAHCAEWSGITWMIYRNAEWRYDPGYSTTLARTAEWKSRYPELLGASC